MFKIFNKRKRYVVAIITKNGVEYVETIASNKKEAIDVVTEVLLKCSIFNFKNKSQFILKCKKIVWSSSKNDGLFLKGWKDYEWNISIYSSRGG